MKPQWIICIRTAWVVLGPGFESCWRPLCPIFEFEFDLANQLTSWFELSNQSNQEGQEKSIWISTYMISVRLMMHLSTRMKSEIWCIKF